MLHPQSTRRGNQGTEIKKMMVRTAITLLSCCVAVTVAQMVDSPAVSATDSTLSVRDSSSVADTTPAPAVTDSLSINVSADSTGPAAPRDSVAIAPAPPRKIEKTLRLHVSVGISLNPHNAPFVDVTLEEAVDNLLKYNPDVNKARLEWLASGDRYDGSYGNFEPALVGNYRHEGISRPTSAIQQVQNTFTGGIEGVLPTATKYGINFSQTDLQYRFFDNLSKPTTTAGVTLTQPLLQGLWFGKPIMDVKAARVERETALHKFRASLAGKIYELQTTYWKLYAAQEKLRFAAKSVDIAQEIVDDSKLQVRAGKISQLEGVEASAGLATRLSNFADAQKELMNAINELKLLIAGPSYLKDTLIHASSPLTVTTADSAATPTDSINDDLFTRQPDYAQKKGELDKQLLVRDYQANQCLPELNFKGMYGYLVNGSITKPSWDNFTNTDYRLRSGTYSAEVELRLPLGMNIKERKLLDAERRNVQSAEINLEAVRIQIENYLAVARKRLADLSRNLQNAKIVVDYRTTLLDAEIIRQRAGKSNYRKIFEIEEELTKSKEWETENMIDYKSTKAEMARLMGTILREMQLEVFEKNKPLLNDKLIRPSTKR
jgi:outer membrane protein TolC